MARTLAYMRTSTDKQDINHQKVEILEYARRERINVDDFISISISSKREQWARRIDELLDKLADGDTLLVTELSRLWGSTGEVIDLIDELVKALGIRNAIELKLLHQVEKYGSDSRGQLNCSVSTAGFRRISKNHHQCTAVAANLLPGLSIVCPSELRPTTVVAKPTPSG